MNQYQRKCSFSIFLHIILFTLFASNILGFSNLALAANTSNWKVDFRDGDTDGSGIELRFQGVPIIYKSTLYATKPGWKGYFYRQDKEKPKITKDVDGTLHVIDKNADFRSEYELRPVNATTFRIHYRGELLKDAAAQLELNLGYFNANLITNRSYTATEKVTGKVTTGKIAIFPKDPGLFNNDLAPGFETLTFDSRLGKMTLKVETEKPFLFGDARNYPHLSELSPPFFWLGGRASHFPLKKNQPVEATVTITIEPLTSGALQNRPDISITPKLLEDDSAQNSNLRPVQIVPKPKQMTVDSKKYFLLGDSINASIIAPKGEARLAPALREVLEKEWNAKLNAPTTSDTTTKEWSAIRIGSNAPILFPSDGASAEWATHQGAYQLTVDNNGILIIAPSARGVFYGVQTLAQLLCLNNSGELAAPFSQITDWPTLEFRGIHWTPRSNLVLNKKLIRVAARYKYNYAILDFWKFQWNFLPEMSDKNGINSEDMRKVAEMCRANFMDPIPVLNGPGHADWLFKNGQNTDLREDPKSNWAYSVNNPETMKIVEKAMNEIIDEVKPDIFHIGADEFDHRVLVPNPKNPHNPKGTTISDLFIKSVRERRDWLAERGVKTMIWGDMLVSKDLGERSGANAGNKKIGLARRKAIPKDTLVVDWNYSPGNKKNRRLQAFREEGLKVIAAVWFRPMNIYDFAQAAIRNNAEGLMQTTWATAITKETGYSISSLENRKHYFNVWPMTADYAWSGREELPEDLPYDPATLFDEVYDPPTKLPQKGATVDLSEAAKVTAKNWLNLGEGWDLTGFYKSDHNGKQRRFNGVNYQLTPEKFTLISSAPQNMAPDGTIKKLTLNINQKASEISLIHSSLWDAAGGRYLTIASGFGKTRSTYTYNIENGVIVAKGIIEYNDGTHTEQPFIEGAQVANWQGQDAALGNIIWRGKSPLGSPLLLSQYSWKNPHPEKEIKRLVIEPVDAQAGYVLAGMTLIQ